jgi:hypothetical protein
MSKIWVFCGAVVVTVVAIVLVAIADVPLQEILSLFLGVLCLLWLILLLTVPWNLYFQAHALIHEIRTSRGRGIDVPAERESEARRIASRMRWFAVGSHLVSAALVALIRSSASRAWSKASPPSKPPPALGTGPCTPWWTPTPASSNTP